MQSSQRPALANEIPGYSISKLKGTFTLYLKADKKGAGTVSFSATHGKIDKVKSSNTKVATADLYSSEGDDGSSFFLKFSEVGKTTISYTYKNKRYKAKVVVKKYSNPIKSLKIGKTEYKDKYNKSGWAYLDFTKVVGKKIKVIPAKGWKLKGIYDYTYEVWDPVMVNNGKRLPDVSTVGVYVKLQNRSTKGYQWISIDHDE